MPVDRCICHQISFAEVKRMAGEKGLRSVEELRVEKICSTNCRLCEPYLRQMLETGEISFNPNLQNKIAK